MINLINAELIKIKRTPLFWAHIVLPILLNAVLVSYFSYSPWDIKDKISAFYSTIALTLPTLSAIFCCNMAEQEANAGRFFNLLSIRNKVLTFITKVIIIFVIDTLSVLLATIIFYFSCKYLLSFTDIPFISLFKASIIIALCTLHLYFWHMYTAFRFSSGITIILGITDFLLGALFLTNLGKYIWQYVPVCWPSQISRIFLTHIFISNTFVLPKLLVVLYGIVTVASIALFCFWTYNWQGKKLSD